VPYRLTGLLEDLFPGFPELVLEVDVRGGDEGVDARFGRLLDGIPCPVYVIDVSPGQSGYL
jgi:hypothetical protein